jgi:hypothetical protein
MMWRIFKHAVVLVGMIVVTLLVGVVGVAIMASGTR